MADYKHRFMAMMKAHSPIKRSNLTQRALGQFRCNMETLTKLLTDMEGIGYIRQYPMKIEGRTGRAPDIFEITAEGKKWINDQVKLNKDALKRIK